MKRQRFGRLAALLACTLAIQSAVPVLPAFADELVPENAAKAEQQMDGEITSIDEAVDAILKKKAQEKEEVREEELEEKEDLSSDTGKTEVSLEETNEVSEEGKGELSEETKETAESAEDSEETATSMENRDETEENVTKKEEISEKPLLDEEEKVTEKEEERVTADADLNELPDIDILGDKEILVATPSVALRKEAGPVELKKRAGDVTIILSAEEGAFLDEEGEAIASEDLTLKAEKLTNAQVKELLGIIDEDEEGKHQLSDVFFAYDVSVFYEGEEIQPLLPVDIRFEGVKEAEEGQPIEMFHFNEDGTEVTKEDILVEEDSIQTAFEHFSPVLLAAAPSIGNLWDNWDMIAADFPAGQGSEAMPFEITNVNELMAVSFAITAETGNYADMCYSLESDIDLSDMDSTKYPHWNPIGWFTDTSDTQATAFTGHFNGNGYTISGLKIIDKAHNLKNVGLFGLVDGAVIENLTVISDTVAGYDNVGILAGEIRGAAEIRNVTVEGAANAGTSVSSCDAAACVGGIAGKVSGKSLASGSYAVIEDCIADNVTLISTGSSSMVGGIAGAVSNAYLVDNEVTATSQRIQGSGYVGGIAGYSSNANIYNSLVYGTIGGQGSVAAGGIVGKFQSGQVILARFAGTIGATNRQVSHEGLFIGTRDANTTLNYGTESSCNASYWFTTTANKSKKINGSGISTDTKTAKEAHVGYWMENELQYVVFDGANETSDSTEYFYMELERGVKHIVVNKLGKKFTVADYADGLPFAINHYAPGTDGAPIRGYLVSVPVINARNTSGTYDQDVASLVAYPRQNSAYYRTIDKDHAAAVAPGEVISVSTAAKNSGDNYYQMVVDETMPGGVVPPTYTDEEGDPQPMTYILGGGYTFTMPECDSELNVEYVKVTTTISTSPAATSFHIVQTRTGDRKNPVVTTEVWNADNSKRLSTYEVGKTPGNNEVDPVDIEAVFNSLNVTNKVKWSVDDKDLINIQDTVNLGSFAKDNAKLKPEMNSNWMNNIIQTAVTDQVNNSYKTAIKNTTYTKTAVLTAETDPDYTSGNVAVYANCQVEVTFQIVDNTYVAVEDIALSADELEYQIVRTLTGDRLNPTETWFVTSPKAVTATLTPENPLTFSVNWTGDENAKKAFTFTPNDTTHELSVGLKFNPDSNDNPAWVQNVISADNDKRALDKYTLINGAASFEGIITATSNDTTNGTKTASLKVKASFKTVDETIIHPEGVEMNPEKIEVDLLITMAGDHKSQVKKYEGFKDENISSLVLPNLSFTAEHEPYDRSVTWSVSDPDAISITQDGTLTIHKDSEWLKTVQNNAPYSAKKSVFVYCTANDNGKKGATEVILNCTYKVLELAEDTKTMNVVLTATGDAATPSYTFTGNTPFSVKAATFPDARKVSYKSSDESILKVDADGMVSFVSDKADIWMMKCMTDGSALSASTVTVTGSDAEGLTDSCPVTVNFTFKNLTTPHEMNVTLTASGYRSSPKYELTGADAFNVSGIVFPKERAVSYASNDAAVLSVSADGKVSFAANENAEWVKTVMKTSPYTAVKNVLITAKDASGNTNSCPVKVNFTYKDNTYSSSGGSGGSGGGGGGSRGGSGTTSTGTVLNSAAALPTYVVTGDWVQTADAKWFFKTTGANAHTYTSEWGAIYNPYATGEQAQFDWFVFGADSVMITGWYKDVKDGHTYYLSPVRDNTLGHMVVGYQYIDGIWYYFNQVSDNTRGALIVNGMTPDGFATNALGQITVNGVPVTAPDAFKVTLNTTASLKAAGVYAGLAPQGPGNGN